MEISFLLGAGFSVPDGYPSRAELNNRLIKISKEELVIHTGGGACLTNDSKYPNSDWMCLAERIFVEKFLDFYSTSIINSGSQFDYEIFYDYYQSIYNEDFRCLKFEEFAEQFRQENQIFHGNKNLLQQFNNTFNQLIGQQLTRWPRRVHLSRFYTKYPEFLNFIDNINKDYSRFHFHTLNHDLLFEELSHSDAFSGNFSDGFEELGSPFYADNDEYQTVRLRRFVNEFPFKFCLYKLHGSIDHYIYNFKNREFTTVKISRGIDRSTLKKEYKAEEGILRYDKCFWNYYPDFLSGAKTKTKQYNLKHYYKPIFNHFKSNLRNSEILILIGYGLGDVMVNQMIKKYFLSEKAKKMLVITPVKPDSDLFHYKNVFYFGEGKKIQDISKDQILRILNI